MKSKGGFAMRFYFMKPEQSLRVPRLLGTPWIHRLGISILSFLLFLLFLLGVSCQTITEPVFQTGDIRMLLLGDRRDGVGPLYIKKIKETRSHPLISDFASGIFEIHISPDGGKIALEGYEAKFYVLNSDGTGLREFQVPGSNFLRLQFTSDNSYVVGVLSIDGNSFLAVYDLHFNLIKQITEPEENARTFRILPDGKSLVYIANGKTLMQRNLDGSGKRLLKQFDFLVYQLILSRNGKRLYLQGAENVYVMGFPDSNPVQLTHFTEGKLAGFDVSPDEKQVACLVRIDRDDCIFVVQREGGEVHEIFRENEINSTLQFTPDGQYIAFLMTQVVEQGLVLERVFAIRPDGSDFHLISDSPYRDADGKMRYPEFWRFAFFPLH